MADTINGNKKLWNLASRCVVKNYNDVKRIADLNGDFGNHVVDTLNPHNVNKSQVGLGNVQNVDTTNPTNIIQNSTHRFVLDTEKTTWNSKSDFSGSYDDLTNKPTIPTLPIAESDVTNLTTDLAAKQATLISGTNIKTVNSQSLLGSGNLIIDKTFVGLGNVSNVDTTNPTNITQSSSYRFVTDTEKSTWNSKQSPATTLAGYGITDAYTKTAVDSALSIKADKATTIAGYGITDVYTKLQTDNAIANSIVTSLPFANITSTPTTLTGYGITDATPSSHIGSTGTAHGVVTTSVNGFMSSTDKTKLDGVETGANNYTHPSSHSPSIITQDASNRFVTDTEKNTWNGKQDAISGYTGTLTVVTATTPSVLTNTITITNGIITDIS